jgi:hypothetical protein
LPLVDSRLTDALANGVFALPPVPGIDVGKDCGVSELLELRIAHIDRTVVGPLGLMKEGYNLRFGIHLAAALGEDSGLVDTICLSCWLLRILDSQSLDTSDFLLCVFRRYASLCS